jgi:hypothetical protein
MNCPIIFSHSFDGPVVLDRLQRRARSGFAPRLTSRSIPVQGAAAEAVGERTP